MIQIINSEIDDIARFHFEQIKDTCLARAKFMGQALAHLVDGVDFLEVQNFQLNLQTKRKCMNFLLKRNRFQKGENLSALQIANAYDWILTDLTGFREIIDDLCNEAFLKELILTPAADCYSKDQELQSRCRFKNEIQKDVIYSILGTLLEYDLTKPYAVEMAKRIGLLTCPYCNRIPTNTIHGRGHNIGRRITPPFDHFFPSSKHPFLSLSFFNLVPCCHYCNSSLKNNRTINCDTHLHPYIDGFGDDCTFTFDIAGNYADVKDGRNYKIRLEIENASPKYRQIRGTSPGEGNIDLFLLEEVYDQHTDRVGELIFKSQRYSDAQVRSLQGFMNLLGGTRAEVYNTYFGNYMDEADFHKRPFAKMTRDIVYRLLPDFKNA